MLAQETNEHYQRLALFSKVNRLAVSIHNANPKSIPMSPIDLNDDEVIAFLRNLQDADIKYLLIGGFAVAFHGYVRATHDLDLWIIWNRSDPLLLHRHIHMPFCVIA